MGVGIRPPLAVKARPVGKYAESTSVLPAGPSGYSPITHAWSLAPPKEPELMQLAAEKIRLRAAKAGQDSHANPFL
jgi:hypothetical protein